MTRLPRRKRRKPLALLVRRFWLLGAVLIALSAYGVWRVAELPAFRLASLDVRALPHVSREEIVAAAHIDPSANVWLLNRGAIARRIEAIPYVDRARVLVSWPGAVTLAVGERTIDGCVRDPAGDAYTLDATRRILARGCDAAARVTYEIAAPLQARPGDVIAQPELAVLMSDARALATSGQAYRSLRHDTLGQLQATLRGGVVVRFGDDGDLGRKQRLVAPIIAQLGQSRAIRALDIRAADTPVVEFRPTPRPIPHRVDRL